MKLLPHLLGTTLITCAGVFIALWLTGVFALHTIDCILGGVMYGSFGRIRNHVLRFGAIIFAVLCVCFAVANIINLLTL